jgi:hypothetical protein
LADVLLAIDEDKVHRGEMKQTTMSYALAAQVMSKWNLRADDLEKQSEETISFLSELLQ